VIERLASAVIGPRGRWVTIGVWIALGIAGLIARTHIDEVTAAGQSSYLPAHAESTQVVKLMQRDFRGGNDVPVLIVFARDGRLSAADLNTIGRLGEGLERLGLSGATPVFAPFSRQTKQPLRELTRVARGVGPISRDGEAALVALAIDSEDRGAVVDGVEKIRAYLAAHAHPGLRSYVTGPGGVAADLEQVAEDAGQTLLIATLSLVLLLLLLVYRAPLLALMPLLVVGTAYLIAIGLTYLLIQSGLITVNAEGTFLLLVLIFGAGTDYSLLLFHRYREELGAGGEPPTALRAALVESVRPIAASAATVIAAMLVLLLAELESTHWLGPVLAIGIAVMLCAASLPSSSSSPSATLSTTARSASAKAKPARANRAAATKSSTNTSRPASARR
jgi:RND superfamily putative drug exporter